MHPITVALMAVTLAATAYSAYSQYEAGQEAERLAEENAQRELEMAEEEAFRRQEEMDRQASEVRARTAAAGFEMRGTPEHYLAGLEDIAESEIAWIRKSGESRAKAAIYEGELASQQATAGVFGTITQGIGSLSGYLPT